MVLNIVTDDFDNFYEIQEDLGSGQFAVVKLVRELSTGHEYAAKFVRKKKCIAGKRGLKREEILREAEILDELAPHPNVVTLHDVFENKHEIILVLELVGGGELFHYIAEKDTLNEEEAAKFILQILEGVHHMHEKNVVHLDLKPENIMLLEKNKTQIKIIDFGISRKLRPNEQTKETFGTPEFVAPEVIAFEPVTLATDMWSIGVITYILLSGASPFLGNTNQETFTNITQVDYRFDEEFFANTSDLAKDFIQQLFVKNPRQRATVFDCLNHAWIKPRRRKDEEQRRNAQINMPSFKSFIARRRWKRCVKAISLCNKIFKQSQLRLSSISSAISLDNLDTTTTGRSYAEDNDDFVLTALLCAAEDGDLANIKKLCNLASIDVNKENKHGETALHFACGAGHLDIVKLLADRKANLMITDGSGNNAIYWAARQGHVPIITFLHEKSVPINISNRNGETNLHVATRYGHPHVVEHLCRLGSNVDCQDDEEETPIILASWHDYARICRILCGAGADLNIRNKEGETGLICAAQRGNAEIVQILIDNKANLDLQDKRGLSALHHACRRQQIPIALTLIQAGCNINIIDLNNETPLHYASKEGILPIVDTLISFGCRMDMRNKSEATALHLAARHGHIEIARFLCLAGLNINMLDKDDRTACQLAEINGNTEIVQLFKSLSMDNRAVYMEQLTSTKQPLRRIKLKMFGSCNSGKTTLVDSLKCSFLNSFFRRNRLNSTRRSTANRKSVIIDESELMNTNSSKGVGVQQITCTGSGQYSVWDFAGMEIYHSVYDHFIGDFNCIHVLLFNILDDIQQIEQHLIYWLEFLRVRISIQEPFGLNGRSAQLGKLVLIGTHADLVSDCTKSDDGDYTCERIHGLLANIKSRYMNDFDIYEKSFLLDARAAWTQSIKNLITCFNSYKERICQKLKTTTVFLDRCTYHIQQQWRKTYCNFPVMSWSRFLDCVRQEINPLASDEHMRELIQQLQLMGEVLYLEGDPQEDLICFDPNWLCQNILGRLLSHQRICKRQSSSNETFALNDIRNLFPEISEPLDLLQIFNAYDLCTQIDVNGGHEFEFPQLNFIDIMPGLWEKRSGVHYIYIGCEIRCRTLSSLLWSVFPRIQVQLRRLIMSNEFVQHGGGDDVELFQWTEGSKLVVGMIELLLTKNFSTHLELKARGQLQNREQIFYLFHDILSLIEHVFNQMCPMLQIEHHYISTKHLYLNQTSTSNTLVIPTTKRCLTNLASLPITTDRDSACLTPTSPVSIRSFTAFETKPNTSPYYRTYSPKLIVQTLMQQYGVNQSSMLDGNNNHRLTIINQHPSSDSLNSCHSIVSSKETSNITAIDFDEDLIDLLCCGSNEIFSNLIMGIDLPISIFSLKTRQLLCRLFDKQDKMGRDWCLLAIALQQQHLIPQLDQDDIYQSKTDQLFEELGRKNSSLTIRIFLQKLLDIDRRDAFEVVANTCPIFQFANTNGAVLQPSSTEHDQHDSHDSGIQNSNNTIASLNR
ncbi:hypothetical protein I4U23_030255 [Adineta vaga]|nr:hypothetical protein I4U23_030255 [Adineta vaga]